MRKCVCTCDLRLPLSLQGHQNTYLRNKGGTSFADSLSLSKHSNIKHTSPTKASAWRWETKVPERRVFQRAAAFLQGHLTHYKRCLRWVAGFYVQETRRQIGESFLLAVAVQDKALLEGFLGPTSLKCKPFQQWLARCKTNPFLDGRNLIQTHTLCYIWFFVPKTMIRYIFKENGWGSRGRSGFKVQ